MPLRRVLALILSLPLCAGALWMLRQQAPVPEVVNAPATASAASLPSPIERPASVPAGPGTTHTAADAGLAGPSPTSLAARMDAWMRSDDPRDAMQAYQAAFRCLLARRRAHAPDLPPDEPGEDAASTCADLRSDQIQRRLAMLEKAARAGERDAASDFIQEGPSGNGALADLDTADPTPPTADWIARRNDYIERALARCDVGLATYLGFTQRNRQVRTQAAQYWMARTACPDHPAANPTPLADDPQGLAYLDGLAIDTWQR
ncbi:MAG: hypothetical protein JF586_06785 [Burkholderiales bacterium]|nr:hypothetical protein [Burkholderiales bacterium]